MWSMVAAVTAVALAATYLTWTAGRVDRLHARAAAATRALDAHLLRRAAAVAVLAEEIVAPDLYEAARAALDAGPGDREAAENDLTRALRSLPLDPAAATSSTTATSSAAATSSATEGVVAASRRVAVARQVHTDLVRDALAVRRRPLVRLLRLARRHPRPAYFDIGDPTLRPPSGTGRPAPQGRAGEAGGPAIPAVSGATDQATRG